MNRFWAILFFPLSLGMSTIVAGADGTAEKVERGATERRETSPQSDLFAVIGQVGQPGVYRASASNPFLVDLVHKAGGLTDAASGYLRIVRQGPHGYRAIYAGNPNFQLRPGDVVVAERAPAPIPARPNRPKTLRSVGLSGAANNIAKHRPPLPQFVQIVFVNLIDRPVVLKMSRDTATVEKILTLLGQSNDLASRVKVIPPFHPSTAAPHTTQFTSPTVVVFDRYLINNDRIPELPLAVINDPFQPQLATDKGPSIPLPSTGLDTVSPSKIAAAGHLDDRADAQSSPSPAEDSPTEEYPVKEFSDLAVDESKILLPLRTAGLREGRHDISSIETAATPFPLAPSASRPIVAPVKEKAALPGVSPLSGFLTWSLTVILSVFATAGIMYWVRRRKEAQTDLAATESTTTVEEEGELDEIINDELPVVEESFELPTHLQLSNRFIGPAKIRIDAAQRLPRPYFLPTAKPSSVTPQTPESVPQLDTGEPLRRSGKKVRFDSAKTTDVVSGPVTGKRQAVKKQAASGKPSGLLDRVLSTVHGATKK